MRHCPNYGAAHKKYYVRLSLNVVQCMAEECNRPFLSPLAEDDKEFAHWSKIPPVTWAPLPIAEEEEVVWNIMTMNAQNDATQTNNGEIAQ